MSTICIASAQSVSDYLRSLRARRLSPGTVRTASSILHNLAVACGGRDLLDLQYTDLYEWQAQRAEVLAARTLRTQVSNVKRFYAWAHDDGRLDVNPSARLISPKVPRLLPRPITEEDLDLALDEADDKMAVILCLAAFAGLRAAEIAGLEWNNIFLTQDEPTLRVIGKGNKEGIVDLSPRLVQVLRRLPHRRGPVIQRRDGRAGRNTPSRISQMVIRFLRRCGITASLHQLRHRSITVVCRLGGLRVAQEFARHASASTTAGYAQVARRDLRPIVIQAGDIRSGRAS